MRIVVAGASGFLGTRLVEALIADGHEVRRLVRRPATTPDETRWHPEQGVLDPAVLTRTDAVINLCGAGIGDKRWTDAYRQELRDSRIIPTRLLAATLADLSTAGRAPTLLNSSAVGYYGDRGDEVITEQTPGGRGFLADLSRDWEAATEPARDAGARVVLLRTGLPLHPDGGLLKPLMLPFRLGAGGKIGSGRQYVPWISLADWLAAMLYLLADSRITGPVNLTGPAPATNAEFTKALAAALHRPAILPIPGFALHAVAGDLADEALASMRVVPEALTASGFTFQHPTVERALAAVL